MTTNEATPTPAETTLEPSASPSAHAASEVSASDLAAALALIQRAVQGGQSLDLPTAEPKPTVAKLIPKVEERVSRSTFLVYRPALKRLAAEHPTKPIDEFTTDDLEVVVRKVMKTAARRVLDEAERTGKELRSYEPESHGQGAGENAVSSYSKLFEIAEKMELITINPVRDKLKAPRRNEPPERPLTDAELAELHAIWSATGNDPELDGLLFEFHRKTGARRIGALNLRLGSLDPTKGSVWVTEKYAKTRELPLDVEFLGRLEAFARSRGAVRETDHVFRRKNNMRMTRKRFETIYKRHHKMTSWTQIDEVGVHWIRHTTLDDIRRIAGIEVAAAYAGHEPSSYGTIGIYTLVTFSEKQAAFERLFGPIFNNGSGQVEVPPLLASVEDVGEKSTGGLCERAAES